MAAIALVVAAGLQLAMPWSVDLPAVTRAKPAAPAEAERPAPALYRYVMAHPIFAPDRAPPPAEAEDAGNLNGVEVLGTAIAGRTAAAALLRDSDGTFQRVRIGGEIEGWKLVSIAPSELVFDRNGERRSLTVDVEKLRQSKAAAGPGAKEQGPISEPSDEDDEDDEDE
jgi:hypothetical protein